MPNIITHDGGAPKTAPYTEIMVRFRDGTTARERTSEFRFSWINLDSDIHSYWPISQGGMIN